VGFF
jgi:hypothetical protein